MKSIPAQNLEHVLRVTANGATLLQASKISIAVGNDDGMTHIQFHDSHDRVFAVCKLGPRDAAEFLLSGTEQLEERVATLEQIGRPI